MSYFGEISEPSTRTAWEDWDDGDQFVADRNLPGFNWQNESNLQAMNKIETLYIVEGKYLSESLKMQTHCKLNLINSIEAKLQLYHIKNSSDYVCTIKNYEILQSSELVELLKPYILDSENIVTIITKPLADYQTTSTTNRACIIRTLSTSKPQKVFDLHFPKLEQPNIISGVSAGVLILREHFDLPAIAIVCFMEFLNDYQTEEMKSLFAKLNILENIKSHPTSVLDSNLYI